MLPEHRDRGLRNVRPLLQGSGDLKAELGLRAN